MDPIQQPGPRPRRRQYSAEFKARMIAACQQPGVSIAAMAQANQINSNLLQRWVRGDRRKPRTCRPRPTCDAFIPLEVMPAVPTADAVIHLELQRGETVLNVDWPGTQAQVCAELLRAWLR